MRLLFVVFLAMLLQGGCAIDQSPLSPIGVVDKEGWRVLKVDEYTTTTIMYVAYTVMEPVDFPLLDSLKCEAHDSSYFFPMKWYLYRTTKEYREYNVLIKRPDVVRIKQFWGSGFYK